MLLSGGISLYTSQGLAEMSKAEDGMLFSGGISLFGSWRKEYHKAKEGTLFSGSILPKGVSKAVKDEILFSCAVKWYFAIGV